MARKLGKAFRAVRAALLTVGVVGVLLVLAASVVPGLLGYGAAIVTSGSMGDALPMGSVAFTRNVEVGEIAVGDIITFRHGSASQPTSHRVVATALDNGSRMFTTKGDANVTDDPTPVVASSGKLPRLIASLPLAGYALDFLRGPVGVFLFVILPVAGLLFDRRGSESRRPKKASKDADADPAHQTAPPSTAPVFVDPVPAAREFADPAAPALETPAAPVFVDPVGIEPSAAAAPTAVPPLPVTAAATPATGGPPAPELVAPAAPVPLDLPAPVPPGSSVASSVPVPLDLPSPPAPPVPLNVPTNGVAASSGQPQPAPAPALRPMPAVISLPGTSVPPPSIPGTPAPALPPVAPMPVALMPVAQPPVPPAVPDVPAPPSGAAPAPAVPPPAAPPATPVAGSTVVGPRAVSLPPGDQWVTSLEPAATVTPFAPPAASLPAPELPASEEPRDPVMVVLDEPAPAMAGGITQAPKDPKRPADWSWEFVPDAGRRRGGRRR